MAWRPEEAARVLEGLAAPWAVAGGWALDLWCGEQTREHGDLEIAVPAVCYREVQARLQARGLALFAMGDDEAVALAPGEAPHERGHQTWAADLSANAWRLDIFREPGDAATWAYHRTGEITAPRAWATGRSAAGIPYLAPQVILLAKAKHQRDKDEADFARFAPRLAPDIRAWLAEALQRIHPGHAWIERLAA